MKDLFNALIQSGILVVFAGLAVSAIKYGKAILDAKTLQVTATIKDANEKKAINAAENCVTTVVLKEAQTVADDLKAKAADGKLTTEDAAKIKADAITEVQKLLSDDVLQTLDTLFGDSEAWVDNKIEACIRQLKTK